MSIKICLLHSKQQGYSITYLFFIPLLRIYMRQRFCKRINDNIDMVVY